MNDTSGGYWRPALLAGLVGVAVYAVTLGGSYVYDDVVVIREDARVHGPGRWKELLTTAYLPDAPDRLYRPLTMLSYAVQWRTLGDRAWMFHLVNVLIHGLVAAGVAALGGSLGGRAVAYVAGLLFAVHPIHVEAAANIVGRAELLCALGTVWGIVLFLRPVVPGPNRVEGWASSQPREFFLEGWGPAQPRRLGRSPTLQRIARLGRSPTFQWVAGIVLCFAVALFSKEQGMLFPFFLGAAVFLKLREAKPAERTAMAVLLGILCWGLAAYIVAREMTAGLRFSWDVNQLDATVQPLVKSRGWDRIGVPISVLGRYAALLVAPVKLSPDYGGKTIGAIARVADPFIYLGALVLIGWIVAVAVAWRKGATAVVFCLIALALSYGMVSNIPSLIGTIMAERLMYLPSVFFLTLAAMGLARLNRTTLVAVVTVLAVAGAWRSVAYAARWNDPVSFYRWAAANQPGSVRLPMLLAQELGDRRELPAAEQAAAKARAVAPEYWHTWFLSAQIALDEGKLDEADAFLDHAFYLKESNPMAVLGLRKEVARRRLRRDATQPRR